jgi:hypothetical protein
VDQTKSRAHKADGFMMGELLALIYRSHSSNNIHAVCALDFVNNTSDVFHYPIIAEECF